MVLSTTQKIYSHFKIFFKFNLIFFILQLALVYSQQGNFVSAIHFPIKIYWELFFNFLIHISLYALLSLTQSILLQKIIDRPWHYFTAATWQILIWSLFISAILSANAYYFPLSLFSKILDPLSHTHFALFILCLSSAGILFLVFNSILFETWKIISLIFIISFYFSYQPSFKLNSSTKPSPNIIILGIDSLSPKSINKDNMPYLYSTINNSLQFTQAISPTARTYPAWASILTGLYAKHHKASENLIAKTQINSQASIIWLLNKAHYHSIYATDDRRFNNIDKDFGFEQVIGPKTGINEILLGTFNDFPLSNLLINFSFSSWLFPYNYLNRASFYSYYPQTFNSKLEQELTKLSSIKESIFLAVHFTLPHWPYAWAESNPEEVNNEFSLEKRETLYQKSLQRVDKQFSALFHFLQKNQYLDNALLIILSDHGETLFHSGTRLTNRHNYQGKTPELFATYIKTKTATLLDKSAGHGSDILSPNQYHSLLAFNIYKQGKKITAPQKNNQRVALIDIAPTLMDFIQHPVKLKMDGISLWNTIHHPDHKIPDRTFFIESGMYPNQSFNRKKLIEIGKKIYHINVNSGELEIANKALNIIDKQKLYGIIKKDWVLALYPDEQHYIPVIQNLLNGQWTDNLEDEFAITTPVKELYNNLKKFYGNKLKFPLIKK